MSEIQLLTSALIIVFENIHWLIIGVLVGMFLGLIPGMGGLVALSIVLPFTLGMNPQPAFILLTGALGATTFSGSITAILFNIPGQLIEKVDHFKSNHLAIFTQTNEIH